MPGQTALIVVENGYLPLDVRVWYEATTLRDAGWKVVVICPDVDTAPSDRNQQRRLGTTGDMEGITIYRFPLTFAQRGLRSYLVEYLVAFIAIARLSWRAWRRDRFDVIHLCNPPDIFFPIALWYRLLGARVVFDHHDLFPETVATRFDGWRGKILYVLARVTEFLTFRSAHAVISTNESYRRIAIRRGRVREDRVIVVRNGPKLSEFVPTETAPALKEGFTYMACFAGVMGHEDGILELIEAIRYVVHDLNRRDILFVLLGDGSGRQAALNNVRDWDLHDVVRMPGMIRDKALLRCYLATTDICLSPEPKNPLNVASTFIKIGEYMAMGKPIVAFDLAETRQTAQDSAVYVQPGDIEGFGRAIVALLDDPERRQQMGKYGQQRVANQLAWEHQYPNLLRAYAGSWRQ